jgi:hypothetical protein
MLGNAGDSVTMQADTSRIARHLEVSEHSCNNVQRRFHLLICEAEP